MKITVAVTLNIDTEEWSRQFPDEQGSVAIFQSVWDQVNTMVRDHYYDMGWTVER